MCHAITELFCAKRFFPSSVRPAFHLTFLHFEYVRDGNYYFLGSTLHISMLYSARNFIFVSENMDESAVEYDVDCDLCYRAPPAQAFLIFVFYTAVLYDEAC